MYAQIPDLHELILLSEMSSKWSVLVARDGVEMTAVTVSIPILPNIDK